jgi:hypothetical protein
MIYDKGLHINSIEAYRHDSWKNYRWNVRGRKRTRHPDFFEIHSKDDLIKVDCFIYIYSSDWSKKFRFSPDNLKFTGRVYTLEGDEFYEIRVVRYEPGDEIKNPFVELVDDILREAENLLRERFGLPRIGEGWVSETQLYRLVQNIFPDAEQHSIPVWLAPQHLDIYIPSKQIAIEYQGKQHYQAIDYFGGIESFERTSQRDMLKSKKCKSNAVKLIYWSYTETINIGMLIQKLKKAKIRF